MEEAVSAAVRSNHHNRKPPRNRRKEYEVNDRPGNCDHSHCSDCDHSRLDPQQIRIKRHRSGSRMGMMSVGCPELFYRRPYRPKADRGKGAVALAEKFSQATAPFFTSKRGQRTVPVFTSKRRQRTVPFPLAAVICRPSHFLSVSTLRISSSL